MISETRDAEETGNVRDVTESESKRKQKKREDRVLRKEGLGNKKEWNGEDGS